MQATSAVIKILHIYPVDFESTTHPLSTLCENKMPFELGLIGKDQ